MAGKPLLADLAAEFDLTSEELAQKAQRIASSVFRLSELWGFHGTPEAVVRQTLRRIAKQHRVEVPRYAGLTQQVNRMRDPAWWRRSLRKRYQAVELHQIRRGAVHAKASPYVSAKSLKRFEHDRRRMAELLASLEAVNESTGEVVALDELIAGSQANPANRRMAMMTRIKGIEQHAIEKGHEAHFLTITAPSRMHPRHSKTGEANANYDGTYPRQAQRYLNRVWRSAMRNAAHQGLTVYGLRVVEPHHDACPHWHVLVFTAPADAPQLLTTLRAYALADSPNEPGASERRFVAKAIDSSKGSAVGYVAKYVSKSIDGEGVDADTNTPQSGADAARQIVAWARLWGIRQFQFFGVPAITPTRELYRHDGSELEEPALAAAHAAAKANDYAAWLRTCELHDLRFKVDYSERKSTRYADETARVIRGLRVTAANLAAPTDIVTRTDVWSIQQRPTPSDTPQAGSPWTRFNNCAPIDFIELFGRDEASPASGQDGIEWGEGGRGVLHRAPLPGAGRGDGDRPGPEHRGRPESCKNLIAERPSRARRGTQCCT